MNPAKNARIRDFGDRARETRKRACAGTYIRGDRKCRIVSKRGGEDERGGALTEEWADGYYGCAGVPLLKKSSHGSQVGSASAGVRPVRIAVIGRQKT